MTINGNHVISKITLSKNAPKYTDKSIDQMMKFAIGAYVMNKDVTKPNGRLSP